MNATDREFMVRDYDKASDEAQRTFEYSIIRLQDAAYNIGYERGCQHQSKMLQTLEQASQALLSQGLQAKSDEIERLIDEVTT